MRTNLKSRFLLGSWEMETRYLIKKYLPDNLPVIELGACVGVVSCITNRRLRNPELHLVVEANNNCLPMLRQNRQKNNCRFKIINAALAYSNQQVDFFLSENINEGYLHGSKNKSFSVSVITLQQLIDLGEYPMLNLICDIEGAERDLVRNEGRVLKEKVEWLFLEIHDKGDSTLLALEHLGFHLVERIQRDCVYHNLNVKLSTRIAPVRVADEIHTSA